MPKPAAHRGAVEGGKLLWIAVNEAVVGDLVELVNYTTLEELGIKLDDEEGEPLAGDTIVEFCIEQREYDDPRIKNVDLHTFMNTNTRKSNGATNKYAHEYMAINTGYKYATKEYAQVK